MLVTLTLLTLSFTPAWANHSAKPAGTDSLGDPLPAHAVARLGTAHWRQVWSDGTLEYRPDGNLLAVGRPDDDKEVGLWDVASSKKLRHWPAARQFSLSPSTTLSANGKVIAAVGGEQDRVVEVFEVDTGKVRKTWTAPERVYGLRLSPNGAYLATVAGKFVGERWEETVRLWETTSGNQVREFLRSGGGVVFGHDSKTIMLGSDKRVRIWDLASGKELRRLEGSATLLALSADGKLLAAAGEQGIRFWNPTTGEIVQKIKVTLKQWNYLALAADGRTAAFANGEEMRAWDVATGKERFRGPGPSRRGSLALSPDGRTLAWCDTSKVHRWDLIARREVILCAGHQGTVFSLDFSPDAGRLASRGADDVIQIWKLGPDGYAPGMSIKGTDPNPIIGWQAAFSADGKTLAKRAKESIRFLNAESGKETRVLGGLAQGTGIVFSHDGKLLAADDIYTDRNGTLRGRVHVWEVAKEKWLHVIEAGAPTQRGYAFSRDSKLLATTGDAVRLWNMTSGEQVRRLPGAAEVIVFHPDGKTLIAGCESVTVWNLPTGAKLRQWKVGRIRAMALSRDGKILATAVGNKITLWDPHSGAKLAQLSGHASWVSVLAFAPQRNLLASGSNDTTILLWDVKAAVNTAKAKAKIAPSDLEAQWNDLAKADAAAAHKAIWTMVSEPARTVAFLKDHLKPPDKEDEGFLVPRGNSLRHYRGIEILERIGTPKAKALLDKLAKGPASRWSREARAALQRLDQQRPVPIKPRP